MIKGIAIILNFGLILFIAWQIIDTGLDSSGTALIYLLLTATPIFNLIYIFVTGDGDDLFSLWVKVRKQKLRDQLND